MRLVITVTVRGDMQWVPTGVIRSALVGLAETLPPQAVIAPGQQYPIRGPQGDVIGHMQAFEGSVLESTVHQAPKPTTKRKKKP